MQSTQCWNVWSAVCGLFWSTGASGVMPTLAKVATGESYKPAIDFHKPGGGPLVENVRRIFEDMGMRIRIEPMPWKRAYLETQKATYLATFPWYKDGTEHADFYYSDPLFIKPTVAVIRDGTKLQRLTTQSIEGRVTCDILGSTVWNSIQSSARVKLVYVNDPEQCYQMLTTGRIDFMMMHPDAFAQYRSQGLKVIADDLHMNFSGHLIISKLAPDAQALIQKFNHSLRKLSDAKTLRPVFPPTDFVKAQTP